MRQRRALTFSVLWLALFCACAWGAEPDDDPDLIKARAAADAEAATLYPAMVKKYPGDGAVWYEYGTVLSSTGAWREALVAFEQSIRLKYKPALAHMRSGKALAKLKEFDKAEAAYRRSLELNADNVAAEFGLASALFSQEKSAEALPLFEKLAKREDEWGAISREYAAQTYFDLKRFDEALGVSDALLLANPGDADSRWLRARSLYKLRRYDEALKEFQQFSDDAKRGEAAKFYIAGSLEGLGRAGDAEKQYREMAGGASMWAKEARSAAQALAGKSWYFTLDYLGGYETGITQNDNDARPSGKDAFNQIYADIRGRVLRENDLSIWIGAEHYGLHYPKLHENDYLLDTAKVEFRLANVGPLKELALKYKFRYAQLDYQSYRREHVVDLGGTYANRNERLRFGLVFDESKYFRLSQGLSGPEASLYLDYTHRLPLWDHEFQTFASTEYRFSKEDFAERFSQRMAVQYRAQIWNIVYGRVRTQYRRDDYPESQSIASDGRSLPHRTDHRLTGEVQFDAQIHRNVIINWGYRYESQDSRRAEQEYGQHQMGAGFTLTF
jgi:cytochrome c-type biogenesis protein CcmH/NrfG